MPSILIRLEPDKLANPDLDLRYVIPDELKERSNGLICDDGYDYEKSSNAMYIYLKTADATAALPFIVALLEEELILENRLADAASVGLADGHEETKYRLVYPSGQNGTITPVE